MAKYEKKEAKKVDAKPERLHDSLRGEYEEALQGAPKKQNVGKALSDKSLEELLQGKSALEQSIANDQAMLDQLGPVNTQTEKGRALAEEKMAAGAGLEDKYDLLDRIDVAIGVLEMDTKESTDLDAELIPIRLPVAEEATKKKKNVGKDLSSKSLQELYDGRAALQGNIDELQAQLASDRRDRPRGSLTYKSYRDPYPGLDHSKRWRWKHGPQLQANIKLFDLINKEIEVKEMDVEEDMNLDGEPSPYDEEALKEALATGGKVEAPDWVIDALLEELPSGTVEGGYFRRRRWQEGRPHQGGGIETVSSPEGGETPTEAAESWGKIRSEGSAASDEGYELRDRIYQANRNLESRWGLESGMYGGAEAILGAADKGLVTLDPEFEKDLRGSLTLKKQRDLAESKTRELYKSGRSGYAGMVGREAVEEEFPEAKKKAE